MRPNLRAFRRPVVSAEIPFGKTDIDPAVSFSPTYAFRSLYSMLSILYYFSNLLSTNY